MSDEAGNPLGARAVACKKWRWMAGMLLHGHDATHRLTFMAPEYEQDAPDRELIAILHPAPVDDAPGWGWPAEGSGWTPDLSDAATLGCLRQLVREVYGDPEIYTQPSTDEEAPTRWCLCRPLRWGRQQLFVADSEPEVLVLALANAP